jgi:hypothetical protein
MEPAMLNRPTGRVQMICAIYCAALAAMMIVAAMLLPVERYGEILVRNITLRFWLFVASGGLLQAALLCWLAATIVRALAFLPGPNSDVGSPPSNRSQADVTGTAFDFRIGIGRGDVALIFAILSTFGVVALVGIMALVAG